MWRSIAMALVILSACGSEGSPGNPEGPGAPAPDAGARPDAGWPPGPAAFRFNYLALIDPHLHYLAGLACVDVTSIVNGFATKVLEQDATKPPDGMLDGSLALVFDSLDPRAVAPGTVELTVPRCTAPAGTATCTATSETPRLALPRVNQETGHCLDVIAGTASDVPRVPAAPCFTTEAQTFDLEFLGAQITLRDARGAAQYAGDQLRDGLIRGFLSREDAEEILITIPDIGTRSIASFLEGGGSCRDSAMNPMGDRDVGPGGEDGWWVYVAFTATRVPWVER